MDREELAETIFEAMNNERIERENLGRLTWEQLPIMHREKYQRTADIILACWQHKPVLAAFEGVE